MSAIRTFTFKKEERVCSRTLIDRLFNGGKSRSMAAFPLRVVYMLQEREADAPQAQILISVPKKCFKRAVKRNRVKRQIREAYRCQKYTLFDTLNATPQQSVVMAFIWLDDKLYPSEEVSRRVGNLLKRISEAL